MQTCLVLFSGGKDSFLTACDVITRGEKAVLLSFNNGCLIAEENILHSVDRLKNMYGDAVEYAGIYATAGTFQRLWHECITSTPSALSLHYPDVHLNQLQCTACQTAMWVAAIAYAKAYYIKSIACGYKATDVFCTGSDAYIKCIGNFCCGYGIQTRFPLWDLTDDVERDLMLGRYGFIPAVLEPKCMIGMPANAMDFKEDHQLAQYFDDMLLPQLQERVADLIPILSAIKLSPKAFS